VRLLDFGIAKTLRADCNATVHNFGSPSYCSPERLTRSEVDQQSDLWAVGATLYEMLAGVPPYQAESTRKLESLIRSKRPPRALPQTCPRALRDIVMKSLAADPARRYRSAREFQADLQAFLERKPTLADMERRPAWSANATATFEAACAYLKRATRTLGMAHPKLRWIGAVMWFLAGMALFVGGSYGWQALEARRVAAASSAPKLPAVKPPTPKLDLAVLYTAAAERILAAYRDSADSVLQDFDWHEAEVLLQRATELGANDDRTLGELALARGYAALERLSGGEYSDDAAAQLRLKARDQFEAAVRRMPEQPVAHLALARVYVYSLPDLDKALAEFAAAEQLAWPLGRREIEQKADAYRIRAQAEAASSPRQALADAQLARHWYARIPGFDKVDQHVKELDKIRWPAVNKAKVKRTRRWR
jgi:hypothetical protein